MRLTKLSILTLTISSSINAQTPNNENLEHMVVTSTREAKANVELSESVGVITEQMLADIAPAHPAEALNRVAGVYINNLGGEGHMTAIRQPLSTAGVYLFLEDGIPTRPTGFFNHNGLYEINVPQSSRLEVIKGPASALYGSDAIGGVINSITKAPSTDFLAEINAELGSDGWQRGLLSLSNSLNDNAAGRVDYNYTQSDGFRDESNYDRHSVNGRLDAELGKNWQLKLTGSHSQIDQSGSSSLEYDDYQNNPEKNLYHGEIGYRKVSASRISIELNYTLSEQSLLSFTPYYRNNESEMMPSWMITYDANLAETEFQSYGLMSKYRYRSDSGNVEFIAGVDIDSTPASYREEQITIDQQADIYTNYSKTGQLNYDYDATQRSISPYLHGEYQLNKQLRFNAGVRFDRFEVDYTNNLSDAAFDYAHLRPESQTISYSNTSPKLGAIYQFNNSHNMYVSYRYAFRAPTVGNLFRPGSSQGSTELEPVHSKSAEIGFRGQVGNQFDYEIAIYDMNTEDDIVSIIEAGSRVTTNAGETEHKGIEIGVDTMLGKQLQLGMSYTYTDQTYKDFNYVYFSTDCFCSQELNFADNKIAKAPDHSGNLRLVYYPNWLNGLRGELEYSYLGGYYTDQTNTQTDDGHNLINLRFNYDINDKMQAYFRVMNLTDELYSSYTSNQVGDPDLSYRPGQPRSFFVGFRYGL
ncbi:MAG: TonB-dependent receptor family protein [Pseudoalteromonas sp.]|uniref:TonB-dependent receptor family protein n=1 Tax=unclassified Pseudoalteromonas TaxID=194690 RepID=UPI003F9AE66E